MAYLYPPLLGSRWREKKIKRKHFKTHVPFFLVRDCEWWSQNTQSKFELPGVLTKMWAANNFRLCTSKRTGWKRSSLAVGRSSGAFRKHLRMKSFCISSSRQSMVFWIDSSVTKTIPPSVSDPAADCTWLPLVPPPLPPCCKELEALSPVPSLAPLLLAAEDDGGWTLPGTSSKARLSKAQTPKA